MAKILKTKDGTIDKRTKEGKEMAEKMEKLRKAKEKKEKGFFGKLFGK
ncbi:MAG: hypothetical protein JST20_11985 [Bacteroidetes bacterium]|nr:hypothetical protein [Bacteroidota bacterium]